MLSDSELKMKINNLVTSKELEKKFKKDAALFNVHFQSIEKEILASSDKTSIVSDILNFIEKFPQIDYGFPGIVCSTLEEIGGPYEEYLLSNIRLFKAKYIWRVLYLRVCGDLEKREDVIKAYENIKYAHEMSILDEDDIYDICLDLEEYMQFHGYE